MPASFPTSAKTFTTKTNSQVIDASHVNDLQAEVTAIEQCLLGGGTLNASFASLALSGQLTVNGFGTHAFNAGGVGANLINVRNTTAGTGNSGVLSAGNDVFTNGAVLQFFSSTFTSSGPNQANGALLDSQGAGGLSIQAEHASGVVRFYAGGATEWMRLGTNGTLYWSATTTPSASVTGFAMFENGGGPDIYIASSGTSSHEKMGFLNANGLVGSITTNGSATAYATSSDARLKRDRGLAVSVEVLTATAVHDFDWLCDGAPDRGVFAQEAFLVKPSAVTVGRDDRDADGRLKKPWSVDYSKYVPDLIVGWQRHEALIAALEARLKESL